jgi:hypothetical protein
MKPVLNWKYKLIWLGIFAIAMAVLESVVVVHLRQIYCPENITVIFPLPRFSIHDFFIELGREAATVIMFLAVAVLTMSMTVTEKNKIMRMFACFVFLFGLWDIFYYIWLKIFINWPLTWGEWDILFLIPWVWIGPWVCPVLIAVTFVIWGGLVISIKKDIKFSVLTLTLFITGCVLELITFLKPGIVMLIKYGPEGYTSIMPGDFWWWMFIPGFLLMCAGLAGTFLLNRNKFTLK